MFKLDFFDEIEQDLEALPDNVYDEVVKYFTEYEKDPFLCSKPLYGKLASLRKTYLLGATYRIVIKVKNDKVKVVMVVAVGERKDSKVYKEALSRIINK